MLPPLPQAKLVATESDPEYGVTVLAHLTEELENGLRSSKAGLSVTFMNTGNLQRPNSRVSC